MTNNIPDKSLEDTGERMIPAYHKTHMVYGEHIVRYSSVLDCVKGKKVLDIASGSGYGTALLASSASHVVGVDVDKDAVQYAKSNYQLKNVDFILGSGVKIPLKDDTFDVVVSFETIEHIEDYRTFLSEVKRVLKPDGLFILSTPNDAEFPESNHFHVHEFEQAELEKVVKKYFKNFKTHLQATWLYNAILDEQQLGTEWDMSIRTIQTAPVLPAKAIYFQMLCSNREITEVIEPLGAISEHWSERRKQENDAAIREHIEEQGRIMKHLENELNIQKDLVGRANGELATIKNSKAWRVARKFRHLTRG